MTKKNKNLRHLVLYYYTKLQLAIEGSEQNNDIYQFIRSSLNDEAVHGVLPHDMKAMTKVIAIEVW